MVHPISGSQTSQANEAVTTAAAKPLPQAQKTSTLPSDTVSLKSTGGAGKDGDSDSK